VKVFEGGSVTDLTTAETFSGH